MPVGSLRPTACSCCRQTATFLLPFALTAPLGVGIGAALTDVNAWAQMVLYAFATGFFLYVGASEVSASAPFPRPALSSQDGGICSRELRCGQ